MFRIKAQKVARAIVGHIADQCMKVLRDPKMVDLYFNPEKDILEALQYAYDLGRKHERAELMKIVDQFEDTSKDPKEN